MPTTRKLRSKKPIIDEEDDDEFESAQPFILDDLYTEESLPTNKKKASVKKVRGSKH